MNNILYLYVSSSLVTGINSEKPDNVNKKLDLLIAIMLAKNGMTREEIAEILGVSYKTIERMFAGKFNKIKPS